MNLTAYKSLYDFSAIETAIQTFFVKAGGMVAPPNEDAPNRETWTPEGSVAFFTAFQAAIFQKARPRVGCFITGITNATAPGHFLIDNNGALRNNLWRGQLTLEVITAPRYALHTDLRATVQALAEMIAPQVSDPAALIGANQYLTLHHINYVLPQNLDTQISIEDGFYGSQLNYQITFSVPAGALAAVAE
jgi:hypothetical protein